MLEEDCKKIGELLKNVTRNRQGILTLLTDLTRNRQGTLTIDNHSEYFLKQHNLNGMDIIDVIEYLIEEDCLYIKTDMVSKEDYNKLQEQCDKLQRDYDNLNEEYDILQSEHPTKSRGIKSILHQSVKFFNKH